MTRGQGSVSRAVLQVGQRTINDWNQLSHDCVNASIVNMLKNIIDNYLARARYT